MTATGSYEEAAQVASKWGQPVDDSTLHRLVQQVGERAEEQTECRLAHPPAERQPQNPASRLAVLMVDGWMARFRGEGWGKKRTKKTRVDWHEMKTGVFYLHEQAARTEGGRGWVQDKVIVHWQGEAMELGRRLKLGGFARRVGTGQAVLVFGRWRALDLESQKRPVESRAGLVGLLSWQPTSLESGTKHARGRGTRATAMDGTAFAPAPLRHGKEQKVLAEIAALKNKGGSGEDVIARGEKLFCQSCPTDELPDHRADAVGRSVQEPLNPPAGRSNAVSNVPDSSWTQQGFNHLAALDQSRRNHHWDQLWSPKSGQC